MERNEMVEVLMKKANVSHEEAEKALEECDWDLLDAVIYLERKGKTENNEAVTIVEVKEEDQNRSNNSNNNNEKCGGVGAIIGRIFKFIGKVIKKGNNIFFEIKKDEEKPIKISLTVSALLLVFLFAPCMILLVVGLFCGYRYSITSDKSSYAGVNNVFDKASKSADNIKKDFKEGYNN